MSDRDDPSNPYGRASAWPQMPQAPFRVGPLPKAAPPPPQARPPRSSILTGSAVPLGAPRPSPAPQAPASPLPRTEADGFDLPPPPFAAGPPVRRRRTAGRDRLALAVAALVALVGVAIAATVFLRGWPQAEPVGAETIHVPATIAPTPQAAPSDPEPAAPVADVEADAGPPSAAPAPAPILRGSVAAAPIREAPAPRPGARPELVTPPPPAPEESPPPPAIVQPPVMALPPATPPIRPATPPPSDPDAPMSTRAPYGD